ncbi:hypothetical protein B0F90DRAFT_1921137 [Multifurca ochricompacta]|uniref:Uncharacterized protein n=1 Tax=Multifurca ochricompacta TaxID=376703 RepID=A0AAD4LUN2_9AGAM|nr:hypothetical protein B0F90DRAFT_1921137 [Multifurca ochricompacta]
MDDDLKETLKNVNLTQLEPLLPLLQVFPHVEKDRLHIVVTTTHALAHHQIIKDANAAAAPSSVSNSLAIFKSEQEKRPIYEGHLANRRGPPIAIYHTAFAQLKDSLQDLNKVVDPQELKRVDDTAKLILASTQIYRTEKEHATMVFSYLRSLLGIKLRENVTTTTGGENRAESDALVEQDLHDKTFGEKVATYKDICNTTCCLCIIISIAGPYIMFGGAICAGIFVAEAFMDFIYLGGPRSRS